MKILSIINKGYPTIGGAQITNIAYLHELSRRYQHNCRIFTNMPLKKRFSSKGIPIYTFRDISELYSMINDWAPDIIISTLEISHYAIKAAKKFNIPVITLIVSFEYCPPSDLEKEKWAVSLKREYPSKNERNFVLHNSDKIITPSHYLKKRLKNKYHVSSDIVYPAFIKEDILTKTSCPSKNSYILSCCGFAYKGAEIFYNLAKKYKDHRFLLIGTIDRKYANPFDRLNNVTLLGNSSPKSFLKKSKIILMPSQLPEGFGRIAVEAMANGIPLLSSLSGGLKEIVGTSSLGVRNFRDIKAWDKKLNSLLSSKKIYELNSKEGKILSKKFLTGSETGKLSKIINSLAGRKRPKDTKKKIVALCGRINKKTAYSAINRRWYEKLAKMDGHNVLTLEKPGDFTNLSVDYFIHHDYQQNFTEISPPDVGKFIAVRTWDFGRFPATWIKKINRDFDKLWVHSHWVRKQAINSGITPNRVSVVPHGVDKYIFKPSNQTYKVATKKKFKFLFVGSAIIRKGVDILLKAYNKAFDFSDDVCLIIKDNPKDVFYSGISLRSKILKMCENKKGPEVLYINKYLSDKELASLYRACDVGVFPYRAEGFAMPILEAMACGTPPIVPRFGACLDYCSEGNSFLIPVKRINIPVSGDFAINTLGFKEKVTEVDFCEVKVDTLSNSLRKVFHSSRELLQSKGLEGVRTVHSQFTWNDTAKKIRKELANLDRIKTPIRLRRKRLSGSKNERAFKAAESLFLDSYSYSRNRNDIIYEKR